MKLHLVVMKDGSEIEVLSLAGAENLANNSDNAISIYEATHNKSTDVTTKRKLVRVVSDIKYILSLEQIHTIFKLLHAQLLIDGDVITINDETITLTPATTALKKSVRAATPVKKRPVEIFKYILEFSMGSSREKSVFQSLAMLKVGITKHNPATIVALYKAKKKDTGEYTKVEDLMDMLRQKPTNAPDDRTEYAN